jgi:hypothetical protein
MPTNARITELDFDQIKQNLKDYFKSQPEFSDYDFEGSGLTQLLNVLALNTHYNAYLANASFNEAFLDSAIKRANAVSRAKEIGYTPRSAKSAVALVNIDVTNPTFTPTFLTLDRYTPFTSTIGGTSYTFYNVEAVSAPLVSGAYSFDTLALYEGTLVTNTFIYDGVQRTFEIPNADVDLNSLSVTVQRSTTDTFIENFEFTDSVVGIDGASSVYFVQENSAEKFEVYFGDGALGKALVAGNVIRLTYLVSSKDAANVSSNKFAQTFNIAGGIGGNTEVQVSTVQNSIGGAEKEDLNSIKFNAPLSLSRAKRIITRTDYIAAVTENVTTVDAVSVWGGEDNIPAVYGKVFISLKPHDGYVISDSVKTDIVNSVLSKQGNMLVTPVFVDPEYLYVGLNVVATYDAHKTTVTAASIEDAISQNIQNYFSTELSKYKKKFVFSKLQRVIDDTNDSIIGNVMTLALQKRITFPFNYPTTIDVNYGLALQPGTLSSNMFAYTTENALNVASVFVDDGKGNISVKDVATLQIIAPNVGTVDYANGTVLVKDFIITGLAAALEDIRINFLPQKAVTDIATNRNQIILLDDSSKIVEAQIDSGLKVSAVALKDDQ